MTQQYTPVEWVDETENQVGTVINKARLDQMQTAHHFADGFREVDTVPTADPGVDYHMVVFCTADTTFYRWNGTQWVKDVDDSTLALLEAHEADHSNPHAVTKAQVGLGNVDNTSDMNKPVSSAMQTALDGKIEDVRADGQSVVENKIANIPPADEEVVGVAMTGFDGYIESPYWRHATSTIEYVGLYVPYEYSRELVTSENKDSLGIIPGTTPAFFLVSGTYPVKQTPPRWDEFYGYTEFDVVEAYMGFFVEYNGQMVKVVDENKDSLGIVPGTTKAYNRAGGLYAEITVDQMVGYNSENPVSSKAVMDALSDVVHSQRDIGTDTRPIKIGNGVATLVNFDLVSTEGDQIINGLKKFTDRMGVQAGNTFARMSAFYVSTSYMGFDQAVGKADDENNYGGLRVVFNHDDKTVSIEVIKVVNGNYTSSTIATL